MDRRAFLKKSSLTGASLALAPVTKLAAFSAARVVHRESPEASPAAPTGHCLWGAFALPVPPINTREALLVLEAKVGRKFALHRNYQGMDTDILNDDVVWLTERGTVCYRSFHAWLGQNKVPITWASIADGKQDLWLNRQLTQLANWGKRMYITFHHEPEVAPQCGTPAEYKAAFIHVRSLFAPATNLVWLATLLSPTFNGQNGGPQAWLPPANLYDVLGVDGYNRYPCKGRYNSFTDKFLLAKELAATMNKPLAIGEWGSVELNSCGHPGDPHGKAKWIDDGVSIMKTWPRLLWVSWTHEVSGRFAFWVDSSPSSLKAFTAAGNDPFFK